VIVSVGGDGTLNEILNGLLRGRPEHPPALAVIPGGTSNVFTRGLGIPRDPVAAAGLLFHGVRRRIDVGRANDRYFAAVAGVGFDAAVTVRARRWPRWLGGVARHVGAGVQSLVSYRPAPARVTIDGEGRTLPLFFLAAANTEWYGAGIRMAPHARADDGQLAIVYGTDLRPAEAVRILWKSFSGAHLGQPKIVHAAARQVRIESDVPLPVQVDGEPLGTVPVTLRCLPAALEVLAPRPSPEQAAPD
jgi:YegS/Rv2252/BmrU family lipid kinase